MKQPGQYIWKLTTAVALVLARKGAKEVMVKIIEVDHVRHKELIGRMLPISNHLRNAALKTNENPLAPHLVEFDRNKNGNDGNLPGLITKSICLLIKHWCTPGDERPLGDRVYVEAWASKAAFDAAELVAETWREENKAIIEAAKDTVKRMRDEEQFTYQLDIPSLGFSSFGNPFEISFALTKCGNIGEFNKTTGKTKFHQKQLPKDAVWQMLDENCKMVPISGDKLPVLHEVLFRKNGGKQQMPQKPLVATAGQANGNGATLDMLAEKLKQTETAPAPTVPTTQAAPKKAVRKPVARKKAATTAN